jgi:hypothetical protein
MLAKRCSEQGDAVVRTRAAEGMFGAGFYGEIANLRCGVDRWKALVGKTMDFDEMGWW